MITSPVFGTELLLSTFIIIVLELIIFIIQLIHYLHQPTDSSRMAFLILILAFLTYNILDGLLPDTRMSMNMLTQNILAYGSCMLVASYYFYYLVNELDLKQGILFNPKALAIALFIGFVLTYLTSYLITHDFTVSRAMFIGFSVLVSVYFCVTTIVRMIRMEKQSANKTPFKAMAFSGYVGIIFMAMLPISDALDDNQFMTIILVNVSFFLSGWAYLRRYIFQNNVKFMWSEYSKTNEPLKPLDQILNVLTNREIEVAYMIIQEDLTYFNIADKMYVSHKTVSKHASNIFKKAGVKNRKEFMEVYVPTRMGKPEKSA